jgi:hypothetical protein
MKITVRTMLICLQQGMFHLKTGQPCLSVSLFAVSQALKQHGGQAAAKSCRQVICIPINDLPPDFEIASIGTAHQI